MISRFLKNIVCTTLARVILTRHAIQIESMNSEWTENKKEDCTNQ